MTLRFTVFAVALTAASLTASAQLRPRDRYAITIEQVTAKLAATYAEKGVALTASQVALPVSVSASEEAPALEIRSVQSLGVSESGSSSHKSSAVKLACSSPKVCLPFYAVITLQSDGKRSSVPEQDALLSAALSHGTPVVKSGAHVTLLIENGSMHIQMSAISSEAGALHQQIKVHSADRKQTYTAEVLDATTVRGAL